MSETKFYDVDGDKYLTSLEEDDTTVVPRVGEMILWEEETYNVKGILHDIEDGMVVVDVKLSGESKRARMDP